MDSTRLVNHLLAQIADLENELIERRGVLSGLRQAVAAIQLAEKEYNAI